MADSTSKRSKQNDNSDSNFFLNLARSFLLNNNIQLHQENLFKAEILFRLCDTEGGQVRISALKLLLDWGGHLRKKAGEQKDGVENLSQEDALRIICRNLKEMGITKEQMEEWMI